MDSPLRPGLNSLIRKVADHDKQAFEALVILAEPLIKKTIRLKSDDLSESEADQILNQVLAKIWEKAHTYKGVSRRTTNLDAAARGWISKVARNELYDHLRERNKRDKWQTLESDLQTERELADDLPSPFEKLMDTTDPSPENVVISNLGVKEFLNNLSPKERELYDLLVLGYTQIECADQLGVTPPAISERVKRLKDKYREFFDDRRDL